MGIARRGESAEAYRASPIYTKGSLKGTSMKDNFCVYKHTTPCGKVYIGITCQAVSARWKGGKGYKNNPHFWRAICLYGWDNIKHEIILDGVSKSTAYRVEVELIKQYNSNDPLHGYNITSGGDGVVGICHTNATKRRMSAAHKGIKHSAEHIKHIKESHKGFSGLHHSEASKKRISNALKKRVRNITTKEEFDGAIDAAKQYNVKLQTITAACRGVQKTAVGCVWEYIE